MSPSARDDSNDEWNCEIFAKCYMSLMYVDVYACSERETEFVSHGINWETRFSPNQILLQNYHSLNGIECPSSSHSQGIVAVCRQWSSLSINSNRCEFEEITQWAFNGTIVIHAVVVTLTLYTARQCSWTEPMHIRYKLYKLRLHNAKQTTET